MKKGRCAVDLTVQLYVVKPRGAHKLAHHCATIRSALAASPPAAVRELCLICAIVAGGGRDIAYRAATPVKIYLLPFLLFLFKDVW